MSNVPKSPLFHPCSRRLHLLFLCMLGLFNSTYMNANLAITITCMINSTAIALNQEAKNPVTSNFVSNATNGSLLEDIEFSTVSNLPHCRLNNNGTRKILDYGGSLEWDHSIQNYLFSASFKGAIVAIIPSIYLVQRTSPKLLLMLCIANKAMMNAVIPYLAVNYGYNAVFGARFVLGLGDSFVYPCINTIVANWFPLVERSTAAALFTTGNQFALFFGNPMAASLCKSNLGWPTVFYFSAALGFFWCFIWMIFASDTHKECGHMSKTERNFLQKYVVLKESKGNEKSEAIPWRALMTNKPYLAHLTSAYIVTVMVTVLMVYLPTYYKDVLLLGVMANGIYTSLPMVFNFSFKLGWGLFVDRLKAKQILSPTQAVKVSQCFPTFGVFIGLICVILFVDCTTPALALVFFCFINLCLGAHTSGAYTSLLSLAPQFTATLSSVSGGVSMIAQVMTPIMVANLNTTGSPKEWNRILLLIAILCLISGVQFCIFGSGDIQHFAKRGMQKNQRENDILLRELCQKNIRTDSLSILE